MAGIANDRVKPGTDNPRGHYAGAVVANARICSEHYKLVLAVPAFPPSAPGQFVQIQCAAEPPALPYVEHTWSPGSRPSLQDPDFEHPHAYLRRPFSIAGRRDRADGTAEIDIIHRVVGKGTRWLETLAVETDVSLLGPLGNGFRVTQPIGTALLVGGGVGIPPMFYLAEVLHKQGIPAVAFVGAQRQELVPLTMPPNSPPPSAAGDPVLNAQEFSRYNYPSVVTTDDGSMGMKGFVTGALRRMLEKSQKPEAGRQRVVVFCCGPTPMMRATAMVCAEFGVECQVSLEQPMACGMGTCQSCVVRWKGKGERGEGRGGTEWVYKLTCTDGPVFEAGEIVW